MHLILINYKLIQRNLYKFITIKKNNKYVYISKYTYIHSNVCAHIYIYTQADVHTHTHKHICIHTHTELYTLNKWKQKITDVLTDINLNIKESSV